MPNYFHVVFLTRLSSRWGELSGFWQEGAGSSSTRAGFADMPNELNAVDLVSLVVKPIERVLIHMQRAHARMQRFLASHVWHIDLGCVLPNGFSTAIFFGLPAHAVQRAATR